jgi:transposase
MRQRDKQASQNAEETVRDIRRATRRHFSAEDKIRIVLEGLRGEDSIAELCRKEGIAQNLYYRWCKEFLDAGKKRLAGDTAREATSDEVKMLRAEARQLKEALAEVTLENRLLKKTYGPPRRQAGSAIWIDSLHQRIRSEGTALAKMEIRAIRSS